MTRSIPAHVEFYGPVSITVAGSDDPIAPTGYAAHLLALIAGYQGVAVSATHLLDTLWPDAPASGLNVVQRHLSALRRQIRTAGHEELADTIFTYGGGSYRLNTAVAQTDLDLLDEDGGLPSGPTESGRPPRWWLEPLAGLRWEPFVALRARLDQLALRAAHTWILETAPGVDPTITATTINDLAQRHPDDEVLWTTLREALAARSTSRTPVTPLRSRPSGRSRVSAEAATHWLAGNTAAALDEIDKAEEDCGADTSRRMRRWFSTLDPTDGLARLLLTDLTSGTSQQTRKGERGLVSLDGYTLTRRADGIEQARRELAEASEPSVRLRCQRVLTFVLMGSPLSEGLDKAIEDLATHDDQQAEVEAVRFTACLRARQSRFDELPDLFDHLDHLSTRLPTDEVSAFCHMARQVLHDHPPTRDLVAVHPRFYPNLINQSVVDLSRVWHLLDQGQATPTTPAMIRQLAATLPVHVTHAVEILHFLALGRTEAAVDRLRPYRSTMALQPRDNLYHLLPVAAARLALATGDTHLAREVTAALSPYAGEYLGLWPFDLLIQSCDELLADLAA